MRALPYYFSPHRMPRGRLLRCRFFLMRTNFSLLQTLTNGAFDVVDQDQVSHLQDNGLFQIDPETCHFAGLQECPQFRSHVVQRTRPDQKPQYLLSPDAFYYHGRWLYEHGQITAEGLQNAVHRLDAHDNAPPGEEEL